MNERAIQTAILLAYGRDPRMRLWRSNTGAGRTPDGRVVRFGIKGASDISGILRGGRALFIEVKSATGRQSPQQAAFQRIVEEFGGLYILARSVDDVREVLEPALAATP